MTAIKPRKLLDRALRSGKSNKPYKPVTSLNTGVEKRTKLASMKVLIASVGARTFGTANARTSWLWSRLILDAHIRNAFELRLGSIAKLHSSMASHSPNDDPANLGFLTYFPHAPNGEPWGFGVIGASRIASKWNLGRSRFIQATASPNGHAPRFAAISPEATGDSEYLLLNYFDAKFECDAKLAGQVALFTERLPCISCQSVIIAFLKAYPDLDIHVAYFVESSADRDGKRAAALAKELKKARPSSVLTQFIAKNKGSPPAKDLDDFEWVQKR